MKNHLLLFLLCLVTLSVSAQSSSKKALDHSDFEIWKTISSPKISPDGSTVCYQLVLDDGDPEMYIYNISSGQTTVFPRGKKASWSADSRFLVFHLSPSVDSLKAMRRRGVKKKELPKDTLAIFSMSGALVKVPEIKSYILPEKTPGWLAYHLHPAKPDTANKKNKKENGKNGSLLVIRNLENGQEDSLHYATNIVSAKKSASFLAISTGDDKELEGGVYFFDGAQGAFEPIYTSKGKFSRLTLDETGSQAAFLADLDTTDAKNRFPHLGFWEKGTEQASLVTDSPKWTSEEGWRINPYETPRFSENGEHLFFGIGKVPVLQDTSLLEEEIVKVEVWTWEDAELYPQQKIRMDREKKRAYKVAYHPDQDQFVSLGSDDIPNIQLGDEGNASFVLGSNDRPYYKMVSWEGGPARNDVYLVDVETGASDLILEGVRAYPQLSPKAAYITAYLREDSAYMFYHIERKQRLTLAASPSMAWYDETNDRPMHAGPYGIAGWLENDAAVLIYDRYDIWKVDPSGASNPVRLTKGREDKISYRYVKVDPEARSIPSDKPMLLRLFNENTKGSGYAFLDLESGQVEERTQSSSHLYRGAVRKAREADVYLFTRESTSDFPDLYVSNDMKTATRVSEANPQQKEYNWCTKELYEWVDMDGITRQGLVIKPENFDPNKKYPTIVYFYERYSQSLNRHYHPYPVRSTINFTWYASRGYVIFIPDIWYKEGYPGKSAYDAVMSGTLALLEEGYVDRERLGIQGHSWGGYQDAYIITQTDLFKCAESGAPVVNMTSAYGGIRWGSGMSRMFQYEHTQSRIGGTLWEYPMRYIENSPLFYLEKVNTPVLILHNDEDGAVPWYQGIEFFVALRRLGKPAWLLNYNGEPHWPVKLQNRKDFQKRMQQFFDHYLMDAPMPKWMKSGVSPLQKGIQQGYELTKE